MAAPRKVAPGPNGKKSAKFWGSERMAPPTMTKRMTAMVMIIYHEEDVPE